MLSVGLACFFEEITQCCLFLLLFSRLGAILGGEIIFRNWHASLLRQIFDRFNEGHARVVHEEADGIAIFSASKAVEKLFGRTDGEAWRLFTMKRAQSHEVGAALFQLDITANHLYHVNAGKKFLNERLRNGHGVIFTQLRSSRDKKKPCLTGLRVINA